MTKKIVIACGAGLATSTMILQKVDEYLKELGIKYTISQSQLYELDMYDGEADLFITSMKIDQSKYKTPILLGMPFLVGVNEDALKEEIKQILMK